LKEAEMFAHHCSACDRKMLIFPGQIARMHNTDHGIEVDFTCWCGNPQTWAPAAANGSLVAA
jgi:hypothetical protein